MCTTCAQFTSKHQLLNVQRHERRNSWVLGFWYPRFWVCYFNSINISSQVCVDCRWWKWTRTRPIVCSKLFQWNFSIVSLAQVVYIPHTPSNWPQIIIVSMHCPECLYSIRVASKCWNNTINDWLHWFGTHSTSMCNMHHLSSTVNGDLSKRAQHCIDLVVYHKLISPNLFNNLLKVDEIYVKLIGTKLITEERMRVEFWLASVKLAALFHTLSAIFDILTLNL